MSTFTIPTIFTAIDKMTAPIQKMEASVKRFGKNAFDVGRKAAFIGLAILTPLGLAAKAASEFENKMGNVATLVDTNVESMTKMSDELLSMSTRLPVSIDDLTSSLYDIRSAGISAGSAMSVLESSSQLAVAGLSTASEATNIMTSAINAFADENLSASQISDILFKTVKSGKTTVSELAQAFGSTAPIIQSAGVKLADFQAATAALTTVGTPAAQAQTQLRAAVVALQKPTIEMEKIFKKLGVTTGTELIKKYDGLGGAFKAVNKASKDLNINNAKAWSSTEALAGVTSLAGATNQKYVETLKDMTTGSNALMEAFEKQKSKNSAQTQILKNNINALTITIGNLLLPTINEAIAKLQPLIERFITWSRENKGLLTTILKIAVGLAGLLLAISGVAFVLGGLSKLFYVGKAAMFAYNVVLGVSSALSNTAAVSIGTNTVALSAYNIMSKIVTASIWLWTTAQTAINILMTANPIGLIIVGIAALIALVAVIIYKYDEWGAALTFILGPLGLIINLIQSFRRNWDMIVSAFENNGFLAGIKAIGVAIFDMILMPLQQLLGLIEKIPGLGDLGWSSSIEDFRKDIGATVETKELVNPKQNEQEALANTIKTTNANVNMTINDPNNRTNIQTENLPPNVKIGTTVQ